MTEKWKPIKGFENLYEVSNHGNVKSLSRQMKTNSYGGDYIKKEKLRKPVKDKKGYLTIGLYNNDFFKVKKIHRLVAEAFIPNPLGLPQINHIDGIKTNNYVDNLEWCNNSENQIHAYKIGLSKARDLKGVKHPSVKLTEKQVLEIRSKFVRNVNTQLMLAKEYNVTRGCIQAILIRKSWKHI